MEYPEEHPTPVGRIEGYLVEHRRAQGADHKQIHAYARNHGSYPLYTADIEFLLNENHDAKETIDALFEVIEDLNRDLWANVPLGGPDKDWDPNDEFKRCAVDRADRSARALEKAKEIAQKA